MILMTHVIKEKQKDLHAESIILFSKMSPINVLEVKACNANVMFVFFYLYFVYFVLSRMS